MENYKQKQQEEHNEVNYVEIGAEEMMKNILDDMKSPKGIEANSNVLNRVEKYKMSLLVGKGKGSEYLTELKRFFKKKRMITKYRSMRSGNEMFLATVKIKHAKDLLQTFNWEHSEEGFSYWQKINTEWLEHIGIFKEKYTHAEFDKAKNKVEVFKRLLDEYKEECLYSYFSESMGCDLENCLEAFEDDMLTRTFLAGYSYDEVFELWAGDMTTDFLKEVKEFLSKISSYEMCMKDPKFKAEVLTKLAKANL